MPSSRIMNIQFPSGGENRRGNPVQGQPPYTTPCAVNMRNVSPEERRGKGGSRPGLEKLVSNNFGTNITGMSSINYLDGSGVHHTDLAVIADGKFYVVNGSTVTETKSYLTIDGKHVTIGGSPLVFTSTTAAVNPLGSSNAFQLFEMGGWIYIAGSTLQAYNPVNGNIVTVVGAPGSQPLACAYQNRIVLSGVDNNFYMSGQGSVTDWAAGGDMGNPSRAVFGSIGDSGRIGSKITSMMSWHDKAMLFGTDDSLWAVYGNLASGGEKKNVSPHVGVLGTDAICITPNGTVLFLATTGLYIWQIGSDVHPEPFLKPNMVPSELLDVDLTTTDVTMRYDYRARGVHLFLTPATGNGYHWWIDIENKALWPVVMPTNFQPVVACDYNGDIIMGCKDGYIRRFSLDAVTDDGTDIESHIVYGPLHVSGNDFLDGMIAEIKATLVGVEGEVHWGICVGDTPQEVTDAATQAVADDLAGNVVTGVRYMGSWG